jgi:hypothetical protein
MTPNTSGPLRNRPAPLLKSSFVRLWCATTASGLATWAMPFILGLAVLHGSLTAVGLGLVLATRTAGFLVAVPLGGLLADRYSRRAVVLWSGLAAAIGLNAVMNELNGTFEVLGTPAEEGGAGKVKLMDAGAFEDVDAALMIHHAGHLTGAPLEWPDGTCLAVAHTEFAWRFAEAFKPSRRR